MMQNLKMLLLAVSDGKAEEDTSIAAKMMYLSCQQSKLRIMFESEGIDRQSSTWTKLDATDVASRDRTLGTYKVKLASPILMKI